MFRGFVGGGVYICGSSLFEKKAAFGQSVSGRVYGNTIPEGTRKQKGIWSVAANGLNVVIGDDGRPRFLVNSDISVHDHISSNNRNVHPWIRL